jgi:histidinol-phosphate aminotransferase
MPELIDLKYTTIKDPVPDFIYEGLAEYAKRSNSYHPQPQELIDKLADKYQLDPKSIFITSGNDEGIQDFCKAYGRNTFIFTPTYIVYADTQELGGKINTIHSIKESRYEIDPKNIPDATLIFLANPNNPSGITDKVTILELVKNNPQAQVVIDEAYGEFADLSVIAEVKNYPNLSVLRSFSKSYSLAGARIGYIISHEETLTRLQKITQWANVSYLSVGAAIIALDHEDHFKKMREDISSRRDDFIDFLSFKSYTVLPTRINAAVLKFPSEKMGSHFFDHLKKHNIVANLGNGNSNIGLDDSFVRIAIGSKPQMETLKKVITEYQPAL